LHAGAACGGASPTRRGSGGGTRPAPAGAGLQRPDVAAEPSSPQAAQIRRVKQQRQQVQRSNSGGLGAGLPAGYHQMAGEGASVTAAGVVTGSSTAAGIGQAELDALSFGAPPGEECFRGGDRDEPSSPQANFLLHMKRQGHQPEEQPWGVPSQALSARVAGMGAGVGQDELNSLSCGYPPSPDGAMYISGGSAGSGASPFFPSGGQGAKSFGGGGEEAQDGDSSPLARQLRSAKRANQTGAATAASVAHCSSMGAAAALARVPAQQPAMASQGGLSQADLNALSNAASPVHVAEGGGTGGYETYGDFADASPMATQMRHAKKASRYGGSAEVATTWGHSL